MTSGPTVPHKPRLALQRAPAGTRRFCILDTNILNAAITSENGAVIQQLNRDLMERGLELDRFCVRRPR
jgi:hypothetical protein